jgi:hypothetical protein
MRTMARRGGLLLATAFAPVALAQTPQGTSFTYQGQLTEAGALASGSNDFQFVLFDAPTGGIQIGPTLTLDDVAVSTGLFTVSLDFGAVFGSERRWLELGVRPGADPGPYTPILPRQELAPGPSALFSVAAGDSQQLGGVPAGQFVKTDDPRLSDPRVPLPGSPDYVQNGNVAQPGVSFNVGGTGTANVVDAATQYNLGGTRVLGVLGAGNLYVGTGTGSSNVGAFNTFVGSSAGQNNGSGSNDSFFGSEAGKANTTAQDNSFFGSAAGRANTADFNAFFGTFAGAFNTSGGNNSFFGTGAGNFNTTGAQNVFVGESAGGDTTTGSENTFVGRDADYGGFNPVGDGNTLLGANTRVDSGVSNATAIGDRAAARQSNSLVLGSILGSNGATASTNVGIGTAFPSARLHVVDGGAMLFGASSGCTGFVGMSFGSSISPSCQNYSIFGGDGSTYINRPGGGSISFREGNVAQVSIRSGGFLNLQILGAGGATALCRNATGDVSTCSSSLRYKTDVAPFGGGLELVDRLRPIRFTWKANGQPDIGLAAEEVAEVDPLLAFRNTRGEIEGVNYSQLTVVLVNALKQQQKEIDALKALV